MNQKTPLQILDITGEICPMTLVRTKLKLEAMASGDILEIHLKGAEPLRNIPRSLAELRHEVLLIQSEPAENPQGRHIILVRRA